MTTKARIAALQWFHERGGIQLAEGHPFTSNMIGLMMRDGQLQWHNPGNPFWSLTDKGRQDLHEATK